MKSAIYDVSDDSGFLAIVDPFAYQSFVGAKWTFDQIVQRFKSEMDKEHLVIWGTGREDVWRVEVRFHRSAPVAFRDFTTTIRASGDHLLLTNYESLTMAAQFDDVKLPEPHHKHLLLSVMQGVYQCRIIQRFDPEPYDPELRDENADFVIELTPTINADTDKRQASAIPWTDF